MKKTFLILTLAALCFVGKNVKADEGMWLPMFVERLNYVDMQKMGLQLTPEELYSINHSSLKDAIVGLSESPNPRGYFCTGEIVSKNGLLFTNHHCGYGSVNKLSTVEHDYLTNGFWAKSFGEELPVDGLTASFLIRMEDVTAEIFSVINDTMDWMSRQSAIKEKISELEAAASEDGKYNPVIKGFFEGNEYYMFVYQVFMDVRLVGVPPSSIGKFGGDTDNWMWPRHTGDFSIFRVYADANGNPAAYSPDNKPLSPKHHLPVNIDGVQPDDFTMIWGFPGSTERYMTSFGIDYNVNVFYPIVIKFFKKQTEVMDEFMIADPAVNLMYADDHAGKANTWKNFIGQVTMLPKNKVSDTKRQLEARFSEWVNANPERVAEYGNALQSLENMYAMLGEVSKKVYYPNFTMQVGPLGLASAAISYVEAYDKMKAAKTKEEKAEAQEKFKAIEEEIKAMAGNAFEGTYQPCENKMFVEMMKIYAADLKGDDAASIFKVIDKKYKGDIDAFCNEVIEKSIFSDQERLTKFMDKPNVNKIKKDLAYQTAKSLYEQLLEAIPVYQMVNMQIAPNDHLFVKGLREFYAETQPGKSLYPDANSTLRMSYGSVKDYQPADAIHYDYVCTANGILEKYKPGDFEFDAPKELIELIENRNFGPYADKDGELITCFLSTNDITGGNSGSPIMNGKGELLGLAFDGNWEAMSGDVNFEPRLQRTINVDIRYVLFIIDKLGHADNIIDELDIVKSEPQPDRIEIVK